MRCTSVRGVRLRVVAPNKAQIVLATSSMVVYMMINNISRDCLVLYHGKGFDGTLTRFDPARRQLVLAAYLTCTLPYSASPINSVLVSFLAHPPNTPYVLPTCILGKLYLRACVLKAMLVNERVQRTNTSIYSHGCLHRFAPACTSNLRGRRFGDPSENGDLAGHLRTSSSTTPKH